MIKAMNIVAEKLVREVKDYVNNDLQFFKTVDNYLQNFERLKCALEKHTIKGFFEERPEIENFVWEYFDRSNVVEIIKRHEWILRAPNGWQYLHLEEHSISKAVNLHFDYGVIFGILTAPTFKFDHDTKRSYYENTIIDIPDLGDRTMRGLITTPSLEELINKFKTALEDKKENLKNFLDCLESLRIESISSCK